jgi:MFS family permease
MVLFNIAILDLTTFQSPNTSKLWMLQIGFECVSHILRTHMPKIKAKYLIPQFMLAHFSHHVCTGVLIPLLPLIREGFGLNYFRSGALVSSFSISYGLGQVPISILADRFGPRLIIVIGLIAISWTGIGVSLTSAFWQMIVCFIAMGLIGGTYHAPSSSFISQSLPASTRGKALGWHVTGGSASFLLTPAMALGIATLFDSWRTTFFILALPSMIVGTILWFTTGRSQNVHAGNNSTVDDPKSAQNIENASDESTKADVSWSQIARAVGIIACLSLSMQIVFSSVHSYLPLYMVDHHGISPKLAGIVISLIAGSGVFGAPFGGAMSDRFGRKQIILFSLTLSGPLFFVVTRLPFGIPLLLALICYGMTVSMRMPAMESLIADVVPIGKRTTVLGIYFFMGMETAGVITPIVGRLIDKYGLDPVFTGLAAVLGLSATIALSFRKHI